MYMQVGYMFGEVKLERHVGPEFCLALAQMEKDLRAMMGTCDWAFRPCHLLDKLSPCSCALQTSK